MKTLTRPKPYLFLLVLMVTLSCETQQGTSTNSEAEQSLESFREWVNTKVARADTSTAEERAKLREEFRNLSARVETGLENLAADSKEEYRQLRNRYSQWEEKQERQSSQPLDSETQQQWTARMMGPYQDIDAISGEQMPEAYHTFIQNVRSSHRSWDAQGWSYAGAVKEQLDRRKDQVQASLSSNDRVKITAWQAEFGTIKAGTNVKDLYKDVVR